MWRRRLIGSPHNGESAPASKEQARPDGLGTLVMIGGAEDKTGQRTCLHALAHRIGNGKLVVATLASEEPEWQWATYSRVFRDLGVPQVDHLGVTAREQLSDAKTLTLLGEASAVFFT